MSKLKDVKAATKALIQTILESDNYIHYHECLAEVKKNKEVYLEYTQFRKEYFRLSNQNDDTFDEIELLQQRYHELLMKTMIIELMDATDRLSNMLKDIYLELADEIRMDIHFIDE